MSKVSKFICLSFLLLAGRFYDLYTTNLYTPQLDKELNPLVKFLGAGWGIMIFLQLLLSFLVIACLYYQLFRYCPALPAEKGISRRQVVSFILYNDTRSFRKLLYKLPENKEAIAASTGYVGTRLLICISFIVGTSTVMLLLSERYKAVYAMGIPYWFYVLIIFLAGYFYRRFFNNYYRHYNTKT